jgi:hypothetical protein
MLELLAVAMEVPIERESALLGRFQHLQRLRLIEGINPGRGKAAEYRAHQLLIVFIALQMLQLGLTPERAVDVIKQNQDRVRKAICISVIGDEPISPSLFWFDPAILTRSQAEIDDLADATFDYGGAGTGADIFEHFFIEGWVQRMAFISVSGTLWHLVGALDDQFSEPYGKPVIGEKSKRFLSSLKEWAMTSTPESLA